MTDWLLIQCLDNPALQAAQLMSLPHAGCVVRCVSACEAEIDKGRGLACCTACRDDCMDDLGTGALFGMPDAAVIGVMLALVAVAWWTTIGHKMLRRYIKQANYKQ